MRSTSAAVWLTVLGAPAAAQLPATGPGGMAARSGLVFESYRLGSGLAFDRISLVSVPVSVVQRVGDRFTIDVGTAYASASIRTLGGTLELSGFVDTDVRAAFAAIPGRVVVTLVGTLPTGTETVPDTTLPLFGATATDLLGFTTPGFGTGGSVTAGAASAFRLGENWAVGTGLSYRHAAKYVPVEGGGELAPGAEGRVRLGIEGPLGGGKYFRGALVYTASEHDEIGGGPPSITGDRLLAYASLSMPLGRGSLALWGWDMRRLRPRSAETAYATAIQVPRGNVLALGARLDRPLSSSVTLSPHGEFRHELSGAARLALLGYLVRPGADLRYRLGPSATLVAQVAVGVGRLDDEGASVSLIGPRAALLVEWNR